MKCKFIFGATDDGRFLVTTETSRGFHSTAFADENLFIYYVVLADLDAENTTSIISQVLLVVAQHGTARQWVTADLTERQYSSLGLDTPRLSEGSSDPRSLFGFASEGDLEDALMQAPTPICMFVGPEHVFTFINAAYVRIIGRKAKQSVLGKPIREAMAELEGQPFFKLLDDVYRTGEPYVGVEVLANLLNEETGQISSAYFDFIYHPVRDNEGRVCGILCQAADVTEHVVERQLVESREAQMYQQWAELDAISARRRSPCAW